MRYELEWLCVYLTGAVTRLGEFSMPLVEVRYEMNVDQGILKRLAEALPDAVAKTLSSNDKHVTADKVRIHFHCGSSRDVRAGYDLDIWVTAQSTPNREATRDRCCQQLLGFLRSLNLGCPGHLELMLRPVSSGTF